MLVIANLRPWRQFQFVMRWLAVFGSYNTRHKSWNTCVRFPFPNVNLGITVVSVLQKYAWLNVGEGDGHLWVRTNVWRVNVRNLWENSRETVSVSTVCDEHCRNIGVLCDTFMSMKYLIVTVSRMQGRPVSHLRNISRIKKYIRRHALITSRLDFCISLFLIRFNSFQFNVIYEQYL